MDVKEKFSGLIDFINDLRERFYEKATDFEVFKKLAYLVMLIYFPLLIIGVIIAYLGPEKYIPLLWDYIFNHGSVRWGRYAIWTHWISDLGSIRYSPAPILYDLAAIFAGVLTFPLSFYLEKLLVPIEGSSRWRIRLGSAAFLVSLIGNLGYIGVGIFSEDRSPFGLHGITSGMAFGGFTLGALFFGLIIILYDAELPKPLGYYGVVGPLATLIIFSVVGGPLWEWMLLFSIIAWIIPLTLIIIHDQIVT